MKNLLTGLALTLPLIAQADPVAAFAQGTLVGDFSYTSAPFVITGTKPVQGMLQTVTHSASDLTIESVTLTNGLQTFVFDGIPDADTFASVTNTTQKIGAVKEWDATYMLSPVLLEAGTWTITVKGHDTNTKSISSFNFSLTSGGSVPEPAGLALAALLPAGLALLSRRRRAAR